MTQATTHGLDLQPSSKARPCPICGRTKDGDCRIRPDGELVICHYGTTHHPPAGVKVGDVLPSGWAFTGDSSDSRGATFTRDKPREGASRVVRLQPRPPSTEPPTHGAELVWRYSPTFMVCRFPQKRIRPLWWDGTAWRWKAPPSPRPLLNLADLQARPDAAVLIVEGEKAADAAARLFPKMVATTWPSGCKATGKADWSPLTGRTCYLWPDADAVGRDAMAAVASILQPIAAAVHLIDPPADAPEGWDLADATDWSAKDAAAHARSNSQQVTAPPAPPEPPADAPARAAEAPPKPYGELLRAMLMATIAGNDDDLMELRAEAIARFRRTDAQLEAALFKLHAQLELGIQPGTEPESLDLSRISGMDWLIEGFIPDNDQTLIWGNAGSGKTTAALAAAQAVLLGTGLLDHDHPAMPGSVLFIASDSGAPPLYAALQDMGMADLAEVQEGPGKRFHVWAADHGQGMAAWAADLRGCVRLLQFIQRHGIRLVLIDSCKAVCSGAGLDYQNNQLVTALLTYFKEVICPHAAVVWLNHDGTARGAHAGAKAWKEVPSMVHRIIREENRDGSFANDRRQWSVIKSRMGPTREFFYELEQGTLSICAEVERVGNCLEQVIAVLADAWQQEGRASLDMAELTRRVCASPRGPSAKTLRNTLSTATRARHPEVCREGRGRYRLAPRIIDSLKGVHSRRDILPENPFPNSDLSMSRLCPAGQTGQTEGPTHQGSEICPDECPGTNVGTMANASDANGSGSAKSRETCTPLGDRIACTLDGEPGWTRRAAPMGRSVVVIHADGRQLTAGREQIADA